MPEARITSKTRALVAERANACCEYCRSQEQYSSDSFSVEHIKPIAKGGTHYDVKLVLVEILDFRRFMSGETVTALLAS
jgi:hypothetical protein